MTFFKKLLHFKCANKLTEYTKINLKLFWNLFSAEKETLELQNLIKRMFILKL